MMGIGPISNPYFLFNKKLFYIKIKMGGLCDSNSKKSSVPQIVIENNTKNDYQNKLLNEEAIFPGMSIYISSQQLEIIT